MLKNTRFNLYAYRWAIPGMVGMVALIGLVNSMSSYRGRNISVVLLGSTVAYMLLVNFLLMNLAVPGMVQFAMSFGSTRRRFCLELPVVTYGDEDTYTLGGATLTAWCKGDESWNCNERSAIWKVSFGDATALLTADMMLKTQKRLLEAIPAQELQVDILKYPHHGLNKLNDDFYKAVSPGYAVITNNGTKSAPAKQYLRTKHVPFALTVPGFVSCVTDGSTWLIQRLTPGQIVDVNAYSDQPQEE